MSTERRDAQAADDLRAAADYMRTHDARGTTGDDVITALEKAAARIEEQA